MLAIWLRKKLPQEYPGISLEVKPNYRKTSSVYINWSFAWKPSEPVEKVVESITRLTNSFLKGKSQQKPINKIKITSFDNTMVIQEKR